MSEIQKLEYVNEKHAESRVHNELKEAEQILGKFKNKFGEISQEYKNILKEYQKAYSVFIQAKENDLKISQEKWNLILKELLDIEKMSTKYLQSNDYKIEELEILKFGFLTFKNDTFHSGNKEQIDIFLNSSLSISSLSDKQIGRLLSGIYDLGDEYINKFVARFTQDEKGLDHLIKRWQPGKKSIDKFLNGKEGANIIGSKIKNAIIDKIIESLDTKIRSDLEKSIKKRNPNISKEDLKEKVNNVIEKIRITQEPQFVFQILLQELGDVDTSTKVGINETRKRKAEIIKTGKDDEITKKTFQKITQAGAEIQKISEIRTSLKPEDTKILDTTIIQTASLKTSMTTSMIIAQSVSVLRQRGDCLVLVTQLEQTFHREISLGNQKLNEKNIFNNELSSSQPQTSGNTLSYSDGTTLDFVQTLSGDYKIKDFVINTKEFTIVKNNKEALENMIHFKNALDELNIGGLWKYRQEIFQSIANKYTFEFNIKDDYLNKNELKIFLVAILKSIGYNGGDFSDLHDVKSEIKFFNQVGIIGGQQDKNISGNSLIEKTFLDLYDKKRSGILDKNKFETNVSNIFGSISI